MGAPKVSPFPTSPAPSGPQHVSPSVTPAKFTSQTAPAQIQPNISSKPLSERGDAERNVLITSALPYVNNVPHLGNIIGSTLSADVYARYSRTRNRNTLYICGTDEYGTATETKALEDGVTPQQLVDKYHALHKVAYDWFEIGFDYFGRTTTEWQTKIAQDIFLKLHANGFVEERTITQLYCDKDQRFLADRYVEGICPKCGYEDARGDQCDKCGSLYDAMELIKPRCKTCNSTPAPRETKHIFLRIDLLQPATEAWARQAALEGGWSSNSVHITESWFKEGLRPFSLTRDLKWGVKVPLPGFEDKVFYVWYDAPIGYPSITANYSADVWEAWWKSPEQVSLYQFMGKDNVRFHTVIFPSTLIGTKDKWTKLQQISTTEYLQYEGGKFSKSRNVGVFGDKAAETGIPASVWRYYLLANRPETADSQFSWSEFIARNNNELLANFGNFVNRVLSFVSKNYEGNLPPVPAQLSDANAGGHELYAALVKDVNVLLGQYADNMEAARLRAGLQTAMAISARGNLFLTDSKLTKALFTEEPEKCNGVVHATVSLIYLLSAVIAPFMPSTADDILVQLNAPPRALPLPAEAGKKGAVGSWTVPELLAGHKIGKPKHLFKPIDTKMEDVWRAQFGGGKAVQEEAQPTLSKSQQAKLAKKAKKEAEAAAAAKLPDTPEAKALQAKIEAQGVAVRDAKAAAKADASKQAAVDASVQELLTLKEELSKLSI